MTTPAPPGLADRLRRFLFGFTMEKRLFLLGDLPGQLVGALRRRLLGRPGFQRLQQDSAFDATYGVETASRLLWWQLGNGSATDAYATHYCASSPKVVRTALARLPDLSGFTFVDLGCGKGRALILATEFPFRAVVGVEKCPELIAAARANARHLADRHPERLAVEVVAADAAEYDYPPGDLVIYLFHPFWLPVMKAVAARIAAACARERRRVLVVYHNPSAPGPLDACPALRRDPELSFILPADDEAAHPTTVAIWRHDP